MTHPQGFWEVPVGGFRAAVETNLTGYFLRDTAVTVNLLLPGGATVTGTAAVDDQSTVSDVFERPPTSGRDWNSSSRICIRSPISTWVSRTPTVPSGSTKKLVPSPPDHP
jgi:hypothetical protein